MTENRSIVVGIDGGATQSLGVAVDLTGQVIASAQSGSINFLVSGLEEARRNLTQLAGDLAAVIPPETDIGSVVVGCGAFFGAATPEEKAALCDGILPLERTRVVGDSVTALQGATLTRPGVLIVAGTSSMVLAKSETGQIAPAGGWGHILGDEGSAWWIAREAVRAAIAASEGTAASNPLVDQICQWFGVQSLPEIIGTVYGPNFSKRQFAGLAKHLSENFSEEPIVQDILSRGGRELAAQAVSAIRRSGMRVEPVPVYLTGGVLLNNGFVCESLLARMNESLPVEVRTPELPPVLGAAAMALAALSVAPSAQVVARLLEACSPPAVEQSA